MAERRARIRRAVLVALPLLVLPLAGTGATAPVLASASPLAAARSPQADRAEPGRERWIDAPFGKGTFRVPPTPRGKVHLTFRGRRGDLVRLERSGHVQSQGRLRVSTGPRRVGRPVRATEPPMWRLPRSGRYTLTLPGRGRKSVLALVKVREATLTPDEALRLPSRPGHGWWVTTRVPAQGAWAARLEGASSARWRSVHVGRESSEEYLPGYLATSVVALVPDTPPLVRSYHSLRDAVESPVRAGRRLHLYTTGGGSARLLRGRESATTLDGTGESLGSAGLLVSTVELPTRTLVEEVARLDDGSSARDVRSRALGVPFATSFDAAVYTGAGGPQRVVTLDTRGEAEPTTHALRSTTSLGALPAPAEGSPVTTPFTVTEPGRWAVARMTPTEGAQYVSVTAPSPIDGTWRLDHHPVSELRCGPWSGLGCGDTYGGSIPVPGESSLPTTSGSEDVPTFLLLRPAPGATGTVDVTLGLAAY